MLGLKEMLVLASGSFGGNNLGNLLRSWSNLGLFDFLLPFLLIFCLVFITLIGMKIFKENKNITVIIALAVALMAMQLDFVSRFFTEVFPRVGIGLGLILVLLIFMGLFYNKMDKGIKTAFFWVGMVIAFFVILNSAYAFGWTGNILSSVPGFVLDQLIPAIVLIVIIAIVVGSTNPKEEKGHKYNLDSDE